MGSVKEGQDHVDQKEKRVKIVKSWIAWSWMLLASALGGVTLGWWEYEFHLTNRQLWMVPFGLIFLVTPIVASCSVLISDFCNPKDARKDQLHDPEK